MGGIKVSLLDCMGSDLTVVNAARVSFAKSSKSLSEQDKRLIHYLAEHKHWTPFGHCFLQFRIQAPIFVARQLQKHAVGLCWNEVSRRYVDTEPELYTPDYWRPRPEGSVKQGSGEGPTPLPPLDGLTPDNLGDMAVRLYTHMIASGVAPEQARMVLPQSTLTEWYWSGSLAAFARVCNLRLDPHAQAETAEVAAGIADYLRDLFPVSSAALLSE